MQEMMVLKQASKSFSRVAGSEGVGLLEGQTITTSDLNFVIDEVTLSFDRVEEFQLTYTCDRTWYALQNPQLEDDTPGGSSRMRSGRRKSWTI